MAYVAGLANGWSMGTWTAIFYTSFVALQIILKGRAFELKNLLQVPVSMAFGVVVDFTNFLFSFTPDPTNYAAQLGYLGLSLIIMGFGYVYYLPPNIIALPSEGVMQGVSPRFGLKNSTAKLIRDPLCVIATFAISLTCLGGIVGIREGTIVAAFGNGLALKDLHEAVQRKAVRSAFGREEHKRRASSSRSTGVVRPDFSLRE